MQLLDLPHDGIFAPDRAGKALPPAHRARTSITTYIFNTGTAKHHFCAMCGIKSFYVPRSNPDGFSVNVRCLDDGEVRVTRIIEVRRRALGRADAAALADRRARAMRTEILMPALSPTMEEGTLAKWHVKEGDTVHSGDVIAEIETDKATMEVEAVDEGSSGSCWSPKAPRA